jgi:microcystin-dependent protein
MPATAGSNEDHMRTKPSNLRRSVMTALATGFTAWAGAAMACNTEPYIGTVCTFAFDWCPRGYVPADGRSLTIRENTALFGLIGFTYGGDNQNIFMVPDLRGRTVVGKGQGTNLTPVNMAQSFGQQSVTLTAAQTPVPAHTHPATFTGVQGPAQTVNVPAVAGTLGVQATLTARQTAGVNQPQNKFMLGQGGSGGNAATIYVDPATAGTDVQLGGLQAQLTGSPGSGPVSFSVPTGLSGGTVAVAANTVVAASQAVPTQPPSLGQSVCIATTGLYPNRP